MMFIMLESWHIKKINGVEKMKKLNNKAIGIIPLAIIASVVLAGAGIFILAQSQPTYTVTYELYDDDWQLIKTETTTNSDVDYTVAKQVFSLGEGEYGKVTVSTDNKIIKETYYDITEEVTEYEPQDGEYMNLETENHSLICTSTPTFNWSIVANTAYYHLQIATDSAFSSLVYNVTDINEVNYPTYYDENATRVSFTLTSALPGYDVYYVEVRPYEKQ